VEVLQLASAFTEKWRLHQEPGIKLENLERLVLERTSVLEETNASWLQALANVQTLSGLIPICAGCKKVRDDVASEPGRDLHRQALRRQVHTRNVSRMLVQVLPGHRLPQQAAVVRAK